MATTTKPRAAAGYLRGASPDLWRELRLEAVRRNVSMAEVWDEIMRDWLERRESQSAPNGKESHTALTG